MIRRFFFPGICLFAFLVLLGPACLKQGGGNLVVARVNGRPITAAELAAALPARPDSAAGEDGTRHRALDEIIARELFVQEALKQGLDKDIAYQLELDQKGLTSQELYNLVVAKGNRLTELELHAAYQLLKNESHIQLIDVAVESLAQAVEADLDKGVPFETLAVRYSRDRSAQVGGDLGYVPELALEEPLRSTVLALTPGHWTRPVKAGDGYQIVRLVDRRPADPQPPPFGELRQELEFRLTQQQRAKLANDYLEKLKARLTYNPAGLDILSKPVDSITPAEQDEWVAVRDNSKYVKVGRLLAIARKFPATLDTAMRKYAIRREIQEDLLYDDALKRGLDKLPGVKKQLAERRRDLLYQALLKKEITDQIAVPDEEVSQYYEQHRDSFPQQGIAEAGPLIRSRLTAERRDKRLADFRDALRGSAKIVIDEAALKTVKFGQRTGRLRTPQGVQRGKSKARSQKP